MVVGRDFYTRIHGILCTGSRLLEALELGQEKERGGVFRDIPRCSEVLREVIREVIRDE